MQAPRKIRASNRRPEPGCLNRYLPDGAALNKPFREYAIAAKIGCTPQTLHDWVKKAEVDSGQRAGVPTDMAEKLKALERENRELRQANEILRKASAYFATAELDRRSKP